jgi:hypothetical protein
VPLYRLRGFEHDVGAELPVDAPARGS